MSFNKEQFRDLIERTLRKYDGLFSRSAVNLLLGTAAQESHFGTYLRQINGPAIGVFQMEPATFDWLRNQYKGKYPEIENRRAEELEWDLRLAILFARLRYRIVPAPLPDADSLQGLASYWKKYYNTEMGKGKVSEFVENYQKFVA